MIRKIACPRCEDKEPINEIDAEEGWHSLRIPGLARGKMKCDRCGSEIDKGTRATAWTIYKGRIITGGPSGWETSYIQIAGIR